MSAAAAGPLWLLAGRLGRGGVLVFTASAAAGGKSALRPQVAGWPSGRGVARTQEVTSSIIKPAIVFSTKFSYMYFMGSNQYVHIDYCPWTEITLLETSTKLPNYAYTTNTRRFIWRFTFETFKLKVRQPSVMLAPLTDS